MVPFNYFGELLEIGRACGTGEWYFHEIEEILEIGRACGASQWHFYKCCEKILEIARLRRQSMVLP